MNKASRWLGSLVGGSLFMARRLFISVAILTLLLLPCRVWARACCAHPGEYQINFVKPDAYKLSVMERMRFGTTASLFTGEAEPDDAAKGLAHLADTYSLSGLLVGNLWKLTFRNGDESGTLNLPLPAKLLRYAADIQLGGQSLVIPSRCFIKNGVLRERLTGRAFSRPESLPEPNTFSCFKAAAIAATEPKILDTGN
jgi:hypothetical protein